MMTSTFVVHMVRYVALLLAAPTASYEPASGEAVLERAFGERESIRTGVVRVYQAWDLGHRVIEREETGYFNEERYRLDIHWHSGFAPIYEARGRDMPDPFATLIWNGKHVLQASAGLTTTRRSVHSINEIGIRSYNVRRLGIPLVRAPDTDLRVGFRGADVVGLGIKSGLVTVVVRPTRKAGERVLATNSSAKITIDPSKGWSIVSYVIEEDASGIHWTLKGESSPAKFGDVWFPVWHRHEQYRDGALDWAREYHVLEAEFNKPLGADTFSWKATGIRRGCPIVSYVAGENHLRWNGSEAVPWPAGRSKMPGKPAPK